MRKQAAAASTRARSAAISACILAEEASRWVRPRVRSAPRVVAADWSLASAKGPVRAETGGGSIELNGVPSARAETGAGGIVAKFISSGDRSDSTLETSAGDITVYLAPNHNISIRASLEVANSHSIHTDFSEIRVSSEGGDYGPRTVTAEGNLNGGGPVLKVRTTTGDISIRRASR